MQIQGSHRLYASRDRVWSALNDPQVLAQCTPGLSKLEPDGEDRYHATFTLAVGPVKGIFQGRIAIVNKTANEAMSLELGARGPVGAVSATAQIGLAAEDADTTLVEWTAQPQLMGMLASVGGRLIQKIAQTQAETFFTRLEQHLAQSNPQRTAVPS